MASLQIKIGGDSLRSFVTTAIAGILNVGTGILLARFLGPGGKGTYSGLQLFHNSVISVAGGVGSAITYYLTRRDQPLSALIPSLIRILLAGCVSLWFLLFLWAVWRGPNAIFYLFVIMVPASVLLSWQAAFFVSFDKIKNLNFQNVGLACAIFLSVAISLLVLHAGLLACLISWTLCIYGAVVVTLGHVVLVLKKSSKPSGYVGMRDLLNFGFRATLSNVLSFLNARVDSLLVVTLLGVSGFGIYSMATGVAELLFMISQSLGTSIARSVSVSDVRSSAVIVAKAIRLNTAIVGLVSLVLFIVAPILISRVYGQAFAPATLPLRILLPGLVIFSSTRIFNPFFTYQLGRPIFSFYLLLVVVVTQSIGCLILIPKIGLAGAALASTIAYVLAMLGQTWYFCKVSSIGVRTIWVPQRADVSDLVRAFAAVAKIGRSR